MNFIIIIVMVIMAVAGENSQHRLIWPSVMARSAAPRLRCFGWHADDLPLEKAHDIGSQEDKTKVDSQELYDCAVVSVVPL